MSDSLWPQIAAHQASLSITNSGAHPDSCALSRWCHPAISSSVVLYSSCPQSLPASESFPMSQLFVSGGQSIGVSASASVLPMNTQDWSPLGWTGWISLQSKGFQFKSLLQHHSSKASILRLDKCIMTCIHHCCIIQSIFTALKILCAFYLVVPPSPIPSQIPDFLLFP